MGADFENKAHEKLQIKFLTVLATMKLMKYSSQILMLFRVFLFSILLKYTMAVNM